MKPMRGARGWDRGRQLLGTKKNEAGEMREVSAKIWLTDLVKCACCSARGTEFGSSSLFRWLTTRALGDPKHLVSEGICTHVHACMCAHAYTFFFNGICLPNKEVADMIRFACNTNQVFFLSPRGVCRNASQESSTKSVSEHFFQSKDTTKDSSHATPILTTLDLEGWPHVLFHSAFERRGIVFSQRLDTSSI